MFRPSLKLALSFAMLAGASISALVGATPAWAFTFDGGRIGIDASQDVGSTFKAIFDGQVGSQKVADLASEATFKFLSVTDLGTKTEANFEISLENTSKGDIFSRTSALGFNVTDIAGNKLQLLGVGNSDGNSSGNTRSEGIFTQDFSGAIPNFANVDVCFTSANSCENISNGGVDNDPNTRLQQKATFTATLAFNGSVKQFALANFGVRYDNINGQDYVGASGAGQFQIVPAVQKRTVPEPNTISAIVLAGVVMLSGLQRHSTKPQA